MDECIDGSVDGWIGGYLVTGENGFPNKFGKSFDIFEDIYFFYISMIQRRCEGAIGFTPTGGT